MFTTDQGDKYVKYYDLVKTTARECGTLASKQLLKLDVFGCKHSSKITTTVTAKLAKNPD